MASADEFDGSDDSIEEVPRENVDRSHSIQSLKKGGRAPSFARTSSMRSFAEDSDEPPTPEPFISKPFLNVLVSGAVMCLVYCAFFPGQGLLNTVLSDAHDGISEKDGFVSQGILYLSSITSAVASPVVLNLIGVRSTIGVGALLYSGLFVGVIFLKAWTIYLGSCITGLGMGFIWVVCPKILSDNSSEDNMQRNASVWWSIYVFSMVLGNLADYFYLGDLENIDSTTRITIYIICCIFIIAAFFVGVLGYRTILPTETDDLFSSRVINASTRSVSRTRYGTILWDKLIRYKETLLRKSVGFLTIILMYNAFVLAFYTMTFETCIGNTFSDRQLIPLMACVLGVAEVLASLLFERLSKRFSNRCLVLLLFVISILSFYLTFLMFLPESSYTKVQAGKAFIPERESIVLLIAFLVGIADAGFNILATAMVGLLFESESEIGFMLLNAVMSIGTATVFFLSSHLSLYAIIGIDVVFCTLSTLSITLDMIKH